MFKTISKFTIDEDTKPISLSKYNEISNQSEFGRLDWQQNYLTTTNFFYDNKRVSVIILYFINADIVIK